MIQPNLDGKVITMARLHARKRYLISDEPALAVLVLTLGIVSTLTFDFSDELGVSPDSAAWWGLLALALPFRIATYLAVFMTCFMLVRDLKDQTTKVFQLGFAWAFTGIAIAAFSWWQLYLNPDLYIDYEIKRFSPETLAKFAPGWTMAEVALGRELARHYTWTNAVGAEILALFAVSMCLAWFVHFAARLRRPALGFFVPMLFVLLLILYAFAVPWSFDWDFDLFIGDGLIGMTLFNAIFFPLTLIYGGFTTPAVWAGLFSICNIFLLHRWRGRNENNTPA